VKGQLIREQWAQTSSQNMHEINLDVGTIWKIKYDHIDVKSMDNNRLQLEDMYSM